jgi:hypothetical protein
MLDCQRVAMIENNQTSQNTKACVIKMIANKITPIDTAVAKPPSCTAYASINEITAQQVNTINNRRSENCGISMAPFSQVRLSFQANLPALRLGDTMRCAELVRKRMNIWGSRDVL